MCKLPLRLIVAGPRDYCVRDRVWSVLDELHAKRGIACVIQGGASGVDTLARMWAKDRSVPFETYEADWNTLGKAAGGIRNKRMLDEGKPDGLLAFDAGTPGTSNMINQAIDRGLRYSLINIR